MRFKFNPLFLLILVSVYFVTRIINLDSDIPFGWRIAQYQHFDEIFYGIPALHLYHYGSWAAQYPEFGFSAAGLTLSIPSWNYLQFLFLGVVENKLIALRVVAVIAGAAVFLIYLLAISRIAKEIFTSNPAAYLLLGLFGLYPLFDVIFYFSNTINEPTIYRLLVASLLFYIFLVNDVISRRTAFWIGVIAGFSVAFVYLNNLFLPLFALLILLQKRHRQALLSYLAGGVLVLIAWLLVYAWISNGSFVQTIQLVYGHGDKLAGSFSLVSAGKKLATAFSTNFLVFSPAILVIFAFGIVGLPMLSVNEKLKPTVDHVLKICCLFLASYAIQTVYISDFPQRKGLLIYLPVLTICFTFLAVILQPQKFEIRHRASFLLAMIGLAAGLTYYLFRISNVLDSAGYFKITNWFEISRNSYFLIGTTFVFLFIAMLATRSLLFKKLGGSALLVVTMFFNAHLILIHKYAHARYSFSETIKSIGDLPSGYFIGNLSYAFSLGNPQHKPFLYLYELKLMNVPEWNLSDNDVNISVFDKFIAGRQGPVYSVVSRSQQKDRLLDQYPGARVAYSNTEYRDVQSYYDYSKSVSSMAANTEIFVIELNP